MFKVKFLLFFFLAFFFPSCDEEGSSFLPGYSGGTGELVVVCSDPEWNGDLGLVLKRILQGDQAGLPQSEARFRLIHTTSKNFQSVLKTHRSVIMISGSAQNPIEQILVEKNKFAKGQLLINIQGDKRTEIIQILNENEDYILKLFSEVELNRLYLRNKRFGPKGELKKLESEQNFSMALQEAAFLEKNEENLVWIRSERERIKDGFQHQISQGILVQRVPYLDRTDFLPKNILKANLKAMKEHLPGPQEGSYMSIDTVNFKPQSRELTFKGGYAVEMRGLWRMENHFMGGPFVSLSVLDPDGDNIIHAFGYVFAPNFNKREYLREVEAMIKSLTWEKSTSSQTAEN